MASRFSQMILAALPVTALLSIAIGPAPSAAHARCLARAAQAEEAKRAAEATGTPLRDHTHPVPVSGHEPAGPDKKNPTRSFVTPVVAKPTDSKPSAGGTAPALGVAFALDGPRPLGKSSNDHVIRLPGLHRPAYHAHAPPAVPLQ